MRRILKLALGCAALILVHEVPGQEIKFGEPQELDSSKFAERTVWIPYWTEKDGHHALLHLRNALHHYPLTASVEVLSQTGAVLASIPVDLPKASNLDLALQSYLPSGLDEVNRSGSIRITYSYQYDGALQAELSIRDSARKHAYTIVGRKAFAGTQNLAYLAVHRPTPQTYVELAFTNPLADREVAIQIRLRRGSRWENLNRLSLKPLHTEKLRILADRLNDGEAGVSLLQAEYSVSTSEMIANAWLEDEATGFSNTALFHDHYPRSNTLYATQLIAGALPDQVLDRGPRFDGSLVFVNFGQEPSTLEGTLHCMINGSAVPVPLPAMPLEPLSPRRIALSSLLAGTLNGAAGAMCSGQFTFTGSPGHVTGRYYAASESKVYGAYVKLEPFVGRAYSEVYWTTEEDFVPILTVTNFSRETDDIEIYISRRERFALLHSEPLAPGASLTVNVRDLLQRLRTEGTFTDEYGGTYIRTRKPSGKLMVKQHSISQRRLMMAPYYGSMDYIVSHVFVSTPDPLMRLGNQDQASVSTCYIISGCKDNEWFVNSSNYSILEVTNDWQLQVPRPVLAKALGQASLTAPACCDDNGMEVAAFQSPVQVQVTSCGNAALDNLYDEYRDSAYGTSYRPACADFATNVSTAHFTFQELNTSNSYSYGIFRQTLTAGVECARQANGGTPLVINSAFRGPHRNQQVGGATESRHIYGDAVDFSAPAGHSLRINHNNVKTTCGACREPIDMTPTWIHFDWRGTCPPLW